MPEEYALKWAKILGERLLKSGMDRKGGTLWSQDMARVAIVSAIDEATAKTSEHLTRVTDQGVLLAEHLTLMNAVSDEAAKALDLLSRQTCPCHEISEDNKLKNHSEGCSVRIACEALAEMKKLMEET